jgi:hypothetical protein
MGHISRPRITGLRLCNPAHSAFDGQMEWAGRIPRRRRTPLGRADDGRQDLHRGANLRAVADADHDDIEDYQLAKLLGAPTSSPHSNETADGRPL